MLDLTSVVADALRAMDPHRRISAAEAAHTGLQSLAAVEGLDLAAGLQQCGNRVPMYKHLLGRFVELYAEPWPAPTEPQGEPDLPTRDWAHSLRGACATLGAVRVQALAAILESVCDDASSALAERQHAHETLIVAVAGLVKQLRAHLPRPDSRAG